MDEERRSVEAQWIFIETLEDCVRKRHASASYVMPSGVWSDGVLVQCCVNLPSALFVIGQRKLLVVWKIVKSLIVWLDL